jgi:hypothetical protein
MSGRFVRLREFFLSAIDVHFLIGDLFLRHPFDEGAGKDRLTKSGEGDHDAVEKSPPLTPPDLSAFLQSFAYPNCCRIEQSRVSPHSNSRLTGRRGNQKRSGMAGIAVKEVAGSHRRLALPAIVTDCKLSLVFLDGAELLERH